MHEADYLDQLEAATASIEGERIIPFDTDVYLSTGTLEAAQHAEQLRTLVDQSREADSPDDHCRGIVSTLEGGYALSASGRSAVAHIKALAKL